MTTTVKLVGGPLAGQSVELHLAQEQDGTYGILVGRDIGPGDPAYSQDTTGRWVWQGKTWPAG